MWGSSFSNVDYLIEMERNKRKEKGEGEGKTGSKKSKSKDENKREEEGVIIKEALNQGITNLNPEMLFEQLVNDYKLAEQIYGPRIIQELVDFDPGYIEKNINIPEFKKEIQKRIKRNAKSLKEKKLVDNNWDITQKGIELSLIEGYLKELDRMKLLESSGEREEKRNGGSSFKGEVAKKKEHYRNIMIAKTVHRTLRRSHTKIEKDDIVWKEKKRKANAEIIFALDASASMKGEKIKYSKMAGIALAYWVISYSDKVGLITFSKKIESTIIPTRNFSRIALAITEILPRGETDISLPIEKACKMVRRENEKEMIIISDAIHTASETTKEKVIESVYKARDTGIKITIIGIKLDKRGRELAQKITEITGGQLYEVKVVDEIPLVTISEYMRSREESSEQKEYF